MKDGVYKIRIPGIGTKTRVEDDSFEVACDAYGWTTIQSRGQFGNPQDYFYKDYDEYVKGFGVPGEEFWLGLEKIHAITSWQEYMLKVVLEGTDGSEKIALYE